MFVARDEHEEAKIIACPLPDCNHAWCKQCQQSIDFNGPKHSCDGTLEFDHLMKKQGWKYCPSEPELAAFCLLTVTLNSLALFFSACKTPTEKVSGCNHMSVRCYVVGFVRSVLWLMPTSAVYGSFVQYVSPRPSLLESPRLTENILTRHFCYICGGLIVRSALAQGIKEAIEAHYRKNCALFEVPE